MTGYAINAKSEAVELHELSSEELDAVSGGDKAATDAMIKQAQADAQEAVQRDQENKKQADAVKGFQQMLQELP
jgi:hypothetical protein